MVISARTMGVCVCVCERFDINRPYAHISTLVEKCHGDFDRVEARN
jgi:hypothetical protein